MNETINIQTHENKRTGFARPKEKWLLFQIDMAEQKTISVAYVQATIESYVGDLVKSPPPPTLLVFSPAEKSNWGIILKSHLSLVGSIQKSWPDTPFRINGTAHAHRQTFFRHWRRRQWAWRHPFAKRVMFASERRGYHLQDQQDWFPYGLLMNMKRDDIKSSKFSTKNFGSSRKL